MSESLFSEVMIKKDCNLHLHWTLSLTKCGGTHSLRRPWTLKWVLSLKTNSSKNHSKHCDTPSHIKWGQYYYHHPLWVVRMTKWEPHGTWHRVSNSVQVKGTLVSLPFPPYPPPLFILTTMLEGSRAGTVILVSQQRKLWHSHMMAAEPEPRFS